MAQELNKRRLQQTEVTIKDFLANPIAGTSDKSAKDAKIHELTKQVAMDRMLKVTMVFNRVDDQRSKQIQRVGKS